MADMGPSLRGGPTSTGVGQCNPGTSSTLHASPVRRSTASSDLAERHAVGDQPVKVEPARVQQQHGLLPGLPEPSTEDAAQGDALLVDVGGDVDLGGPARVPTVTSVASRRRASNTDGRAPWAPEHSKATSNPPRRPVSSRHRSTTSSAGRHRQGPESFGLGAAVGVGLDHDDVRGAHQPGQVGDDEPDRPGAADQHGASGDGVAGPLDRVYGDPGGLEQGAGFQGGVIGQLDADVLRRGHVLGEHRRRCACR